MFFSFFLFSLFLHTSITKNMSTPKHASELALRLAEERIQSPANNKPYEHHVGTWACTMLSRHFTGDFLITPEKIENQSKKRPDLTIEKLNENVPNVSVYHVAYELKKKDSEEQLYDALNQVTKAIGQISEEEGSVEMFVIVQRGMELGFFEYFSYKNMLDEEDIENFKGCVPLTYKHKSLLFVEEEAEKKLSEIIKNLPSDLSHLISKPLRRKSSDTLNEADNIQTLCIFNLNIHKNEIDSLFHYIATFSPRKMED